MAGNTCPIIPESTIDEDDLGRKAVQHYLGNRSLTDAEGKLLEKRDLSGVNVLRNINMPNGRLRSGQTSYANDSFIEILDSMSRAQFDNRSVFDIDPHEVDELAPQLHNLVKKDFDLARGNTKINKFFALWDAGATGSNENLLWLTPNIPRQLVGNIGIGMLFQEIMAGQWHKALSTAAWGLHYISQYLYQKTRRLIGLTSQDVQTGYGKFLADTGMVNRSEYESHVGAISASFDAAEKGRPRGSETVTGKVMTSPIALFRKTADWMADGEISPALNHTLNAAEEVVLTAGPRGYSYMRSLAGHSEKAITGAGFGYEWKKIYHAEIAATNQRLSQEFVDTMVRYYPDKEGWARGIADAVISSMPRRFTPNELALTIDSLIEMDFRAGRISAENLLAAKRASAKWVDGHLSWMEGGVERATTENQKGLFKWGNRNIDVWGSRFFPFFRFYSRYLPFAFNTMAKHPGLTHAYVRMNEGLQQEAQERGWPGWAQQYLKLTGGPLGMTVALNPWQALGMLSVAFVADQSPDFIKRNRLQSFIQNVVFNNGITPAPHWFFVFPLEATGLMGPQTKVTNPIQRTMMLASVENAVNLINSYGRNEGPIAPIGMSTINSIAEALSAAFPVGSDLNLSDPAQKINTMIEMQMVNDYLVDNGWTMEYFLGIQSQYERKVAGDFSLGAVDAGLAQQYLDAMTMLGTQLQEEEGDYYDRAFDEVMAMQAGKGGELFTAFGFKEFGAQQGSILALARMTMGATIAEPSIQLDENAPAYPGLYEDFLADESLQLALKQHGIDPASFYSRAYYTSAFNKEISTMDSASQEAQQLVRTNVAYSMIGGPDTQLMVDRYWQIMNGTTSMDITFWEGETSHTLSPTEVAALSDSQREQLANVWLGMWATGSKHSPTLTTFESPKFIVDTVGQNQDAMAEANPEYNGYVTWKENRENWEDAGGLKLYRDLVCGSGPGGNAGQCDYYRSTESLIREEIANDKSIAEADRGRELAARMDASTFSLTAYMAAYGIEYKNNQNTSDAGAQPELPASSGGAAVATEPADSTPGKVTVKRVNEALAAHQAYEAQVAAYFASQGIEAGSIREIAPPYQPQAMQMLAEAGIVAPADDYLALDYLAFQMMAQSTGEETTVDEYVMFLTDENLKPGDWNLGRQSTNMGGWSFTTGIDWGGTAPGVAPQAGFLRAPSMGQRYSELEQMAGSGANVGMGQDIGFGGNTMGFNQGMGQQTSFSTSPQNSYGLGQGTRGFTTPGQNVGMGQRVDNLARKIAAR